MKILNVIMSLDPITGGGTAERTVKMSEAILREDTECIILTTDVGLTPEYIRSLKDIKIIALPCLLKRFYVPLFRYAEIKKIVKEVDVVHIMGHWTVINAIIYIVARINNKPYVVCPAGTLQIFGRSKFIKWLYNFFVGKKIIRNASKLVAITNDEAGLFKTYGVESKKVCIIPNGINASDFKLKDDIGFREKYQLGNAPFVLFMGRINLIKGPDLLLHAFCKAKDKLMPYHLVFAGPDGGMLSELKQITEKFGVQNRVHFVGFLGREDKSKAYHAADLLAIPSRQEAMSIVVLEAGITSTPVLVTDKCGVNNIENIKGGLVVSASVEGLKEGLVEILKNRNGLKLMGEVLLKLTSENYTWKIVAQEYLSLYRKILGIDISRDSIQRIVSLD